MRTLLALCRLSLLLLAVKTLAEDHRLRAPENDEHRTRRKPKWSHFFVMHEPRSEEKDKAQGFFYQVGSGPPVINRLRSNPSGFQSQTGGGGNMPRYNPVLHSPYPNQHQTPQQFGSRMMPDSFGARMPNPPNPSIFDQPQPENPAGATFNPEIPPDNVQNFQSGSQGVLEHEENFPENLNAPLQFVPSTLGDVDSKSGTEGLRTQGPVSSHATLLLQGNHQNSAAPSDSAKDSPVSVKGKPSFVVGGQSMFGKRKPLHSHLTPIIPPAINQPDGKSSTGDNSDQERENMRLSVAQHIPIRTGHILPVLDQDHSEREGSGLGLSRPDNSATLLGLNKEPQFFGTEIPKAAIALGNDEPREREIVNNTPNQNSYGQKITLADNQPQKKESIDSEGNLREKEQHGEIGKQLITSGWQLQPRLNPQSQEGTPERFFENPRNGREREPISRDFEKPTYQTHHVKESGSPHLLPQKYNYLPVSQQYAHGNNAYNPPSLLNFNTNIHLHGASPNANFQQEPKQPSHSLSVHPYVLERPASEAIQPALQKDVQTSDDYNGRIPSSQVYLLRPSNVPDVPLAISGPQNGPYRQDNRGHFGGEANFRTSQTPSHLTAIFPVNLGHSKENVGQGVPQNIFTSNAKEKIPNVEYSDLLLRNQPQDAIAPSVNPATNTASHSFRLLLPQQQLPQFSPTDVPSGVHHIPGTPNRFQTHQVNLLPNSHGYVQTQVQLPPLNFRFQLTPVKDDSNGSFGDISDTQKIAQPNFQPIPYQYQLPLQPVPIQGTHQILFPNLQIANVPLETPKISLDEGQGSTTKSTDGHADLTEKPEPVTRPSVIEDAVDKKKTLKDNIVGKEDSRKRTEDHVSIPSATTEEISEDDKGEVLKSASPSSNLFEKEEDEENSTKEDTVVKFPTPHEGKTDEKATTESENAHIQLSSSTVHFNEKEEKDISTTDDTNLELTTKSQPSSVKPNLDLPSVLTFTETPKPEDGAIRILDDVTTEGTKLAEEKSFTTSGDLEISSLSTDDSAADKSSDEFSTTAAKAPTTVSTRESTTLEQSTEGLADESGNELSTTFSESPAPVGTMESTMLEQSAGDLLSTTVSEAPATVSTKESNTPEQSTVDLLSTAVSEAPATVSTKESTTLEQSTVDLADKSRSELSTTTTEVPTTASSSESTILVQDRTSTRETELNTGGVSGTSDLPQEIRVEDSTVSNPNTDSITSVVSEHTFSTETPESFSTTNSPSSIDTTTPTITRTNDMSSVRTEVEIVTELSETTSGSTESILPSSSETTVSTKDTTSDSTAETSVSSVESSATKLPEDIVTTTTTSSSSVETEENIFSVELETVTASVSQTSTEASQTSTGGSDRIAITEIVSLPDTSSTTTIANASDTDAANEIEQFFTSPAIGSSSTSSPKAPVTTGSFGDTFSVFNQLTVFTFTEAPIPKIQTEKTNVEAKGLTPEEKTKDSGTQTDREESDQTEKIENDKDDTSSISTSVSKDPEIFLNEISVVQTSTQTVDDAINEEKINKTFREELLKKANETSLEPKLKTTKPSEDRAIFTFVGNNIPQITEEKTEFSWVAVTSSSSVSTEDNKTEVLFTEKVTEATLDHEIPLSTLNTETQSDHQATSGSDRDLLGVLNGRERNENEVPVVENSRTSNTTEQDSDVEVRSDTDITGLDSKETTNKSEKERTTTATIESQDTFTFSSETPKSSDTDSSVTPDSETSTDSHRSDPSALETTTNDVGNNKIAGSSDGSSQEMPMIIDTDALELLLNNLVTPRNLSFLAPVTSTSISISIGIPSESPEQIYDEDKTQLSENSATGQNNDIFGLGNTSATVGKNEAQADNTDRPESDNGSSFFSKVFEKSLLPLDNNSQNSPEDPLSEAKTSEDTISGEKAQSESDQESIRSQSSQTSSPTTESSGSLSETQVTSASVSSETEMPVSDRSSVKLTVLENFEGKDIPDFTEILKQHAR